MQRIAERIGRALERVGLLERDVEQSYLALEAEGGGPMDDLLGHSITYRVAVGPRAGQKVFALQTVPARADAEPRQGVAQYAGFSLHAGTAVAGEEREKLERLARYVTRPPVAVERLTLTLQGQVRYRLKTPYRDGTTHVVFEPLDFLARLAALVPPPRVHLTRYHGVFAPHAALRAAITPAGRGRSSGSAGAAVERVTPKHVAMSWMQRLKRGASDRDRALPGLWRTAYSDREHRGSGADRADSGAREAAGGGRTAAAAGGAGAAAVAALIGSPCGF